MCLQRSPRMTRLEHSSISAARILYPSKCPTPPFRNLQNPIPQQDVWAVSLYKRRQQKASSEKHKIISILYRVPKNRFTLHFLGITLWQGATLFLPKYPVLWQALLLLWAAGIPTYGCQHFRLQKLRNVKVFLKLGKKTPKVLTIDSLLSPSCLCFCILKACLPSFSKACLYWNLLFFSKHHSSLPRNINKYVEKNNPQTCHPFLPYSCSLQLR